MMATVCLYIASDTILLSKESSVWKVFLHLLREISELYTICVILAVNLLFNPLINCLCVQTQEHFQPRVHGFEVGMKLEAVHPMKPSIICPATVTKSLGPYYFAVTTDYQENVPSVTFCCHSDSPGIFPAGWCSRHQVDLSVPASKWCLTICVIIFCDLSWCNNFKFF